MSDNLERLKARDEHLAQWAAGEIEELRASLSDLRDVVIDHNRSGTAWKTTEFARMMDALAKADALLTHNA